VDQDEMATVDLREVAADGAPPEDSSGQPKQLEWTDSVRASVQVLTKEDLAIREFEANRDRLAKAGFPFGAKQDLESLKPRE